MLNHFINKDQQYYFLFLNIFQGIVKQVSSAFVSGELFLMCLHLPFKTIKTALFLRCLFCVLFYSGTTQNNFIVICRCFLRSFYLEQYNFLFYNLLIIPENNHHPKQIFLQHLRNYQILCLSIHL